MTYSDPLSTFFMRRIYSDPNLPAFVCAAGGCLRVRLGYKFDGRFVVPADMFEVVLAVVGERRPLHTLAQLSPAGGRGARNVADAYRPEVP